MRVTDDGAAITIRREGASAREGRLEDGVLFYPDAFPGADALLVAQGEGVEELIVARSPAAELVYALDLPAGWRLRAHGEQGLAEVLDGRGVARLRLRADRAWDAGGAPVPLALMVEGSRLRLRVEGAARWPVVVDPVFVGTGSSVWPRHQHTATRLTDGTVLVVGGAPPPALTAEIYDPLTGTFTATASPMVSVHRSHTATLLEDGRVLLTGGNDNNPDPNTPALTAAEIYDPATGRFTATATPMATHRDGHSATLLADGKVLVFGGDKNSLVPEGAAEIFDPQTGAFSLTGHPANRWRRYHTATTLDDGRVLLAGGDKGFALDDPPPEGTAEIYDPQTGEFSLLPARMSGLRSHHTATKLEDGKILLVGGKRADGLRSAEIFDPIAGTFTLAPASLTAMRRDHTATRLQNGRILFAGGLGTEHPFDTTDEHLGTAEIYDPTTGLFSLIASRLTPRRTDHTATDLGNDRILFIGGTEDPSGTDAGVFVPGALTVSTGALALARTAHTATDLEDGHILLAGGTLNPIPGDIYDAATGQFRRTSAPIVLPRKYHAATRLEDGKVLIAGGQLTDPNALPLATAVVRDAEIYDPPSGLFTPIGSLMNAPRMQATATRLASGKVLIAGGIGNDSAQSSAELFDRDTGTFTPTKTPMHADRSSHTATLLAQGKVLLAGGTGVLPEQAIAEIYDPATDTFTKTSQLMVALRSNHTATTLPDGTILLAGGDQSTPGTAEIYDPKASSFALLPSRLTAPRSTHTATALSDGRVLLAGGVDHDQIPLASAEIYDPKSGLFTPLPAPMTAARGGHTATRLPGGRVLLVGGHGEKSPLDVAEIFDPATGTFTAVAAPPLAAGDGATETPDGQLLLPGGGPGGGSSLLLSRDGHTTPGPVKIDRAGHATLLLPDLSYLLVGGTSADGSHPDSIVSLSPTGATTVVGALKHPRSRHSATRLPDGRILVAGGEDPGGPLGSFELLTPGQATTQVGALLQPRTRHAAGLLPDGRVLLVGGTNQQGDLAIAEVFDPVSQTTAGLGEARVGAEAALGFVGSAALIVSGGRKSVRFEPATSAFLDLDLEASSRIATLATGQALACREVCRFLGEHSPTGGAAGPFALLPGDHIKAMGTSALGLAGDREGHGWVGAGSVVESGASQPSLAPLPKDTWQAGEKVTLSGQGWPATGPNTAPPRLDDPAIIAWKPLDSAGPVHPLPVQQWGEGFVDFTLPTTAYSGPGWLYAIVNGVPGEGHLLILQPAPQGKFCGINAHCASGFCVDGVCCDSACHDGCRSCSAAIKGAGQDGLCEPITRHQKPRSGCEPSTSNPCGPLGTCDGAGSCELPPSTTACEGAPSGRCIAGICTTPPPGACDPDGITLVTSDNQRLSCAPFTCQAGACRSQCTTAADCASGADCRGGVCTTSCNAAGTSIVRVTATGPGERSCNEYRCRDGECLGRCASHLDCSPGNRCTTDRRCEVALAPQESGDPGATCAASPGRTSRGSLAVALLIAGVAGLRRRRRRAATVGAVGVALSLTSLPLGAQQAGAPPGSASAAPPAPPTSAAPAAPASSASDQRKEEARDLLRKGLALYQAGDVPRALDFFLQSRQVFPAKGNTLNIAHSLRTLGRADEALDFYEEAVAGYASSFDEDDRVAVPAAMARMRAQVGELFVSASANGSLVVDGRERGKLPLSSAIHLLPGEHTVRVIKDGYRTFEKIIQIRIGEKTAVDAPLRPLAAAGGLRIEDPTLDGAEVVVDGVVVGRTPWEGTLAPGPHVVLSRKGPDGSAPTLATVLQGQTALLRLRSSRLGATRRLRVRPETAELWVDEVPLGKGQWVGALPAGPHTISAAEEGYQTITQTISVTDDGRDLDLDLAVDSAHPRWPRKPAGQLSAEFRAIFGVGTGLRGGAESSCAANSCRNRGLLTGPAAALAASYEFPFRLSIDAAVGVLTLSQRLGREIPAVGAQASYRIDDLLRLKGYWLGIGAGYRHPLGGRWSLRARILTGVLFARSSDTISAAVSTTSGQDRASSDGSGTEVASTPLFVLPEVGVTASVGDWQLAGALTAWVLLSSGPPLPLGALQVFPGCTGKDPAAPGCVGDSSQLTGERSYQPFILLSPQLSLARSF
jgi:hypothetical protein